MLFQSIGFLMGMLTQANIYPWYEQLNKSALTPPGFVFSIVWTFLYALLALIAWTLSDKNQAHSKQVKLGRVFKVFQTIKNLIKSLHSENGANGCQDLLLMTKCGTN
ncbi:TspO/MBR family protein [Legionella sp. 27cVA30]|uniref:TspO/MBR family protein n=1 Tax=Legionella sp. 27cVA30 TaxID=2905657 RepID=UPI00353227A9